MITAKVNRPAFDEKITTHPSVKLTATVKHGAVSKEYDLNLIVRMLGVTDSQAVILDLNDLVVPATTNENLTLPMIGKNGCEIKWTTSDATTVTNTGVVTRPSYDKTDSTIKLTATCIKGTENQTKEFSVIVKCWTIAEEVETAKAAITWDLIKGTNTNSQAIDGNLVLPAIVGRQVVSTWSIVSSSAVTGVTTGKLDIATGVITKPTFTQGQVSIQIKCVLTKNTETKEVILPPFILAPAPMIDSEVLTAAYGLLESNKFLGTNTSVSNIISSMQLPFKLADATASRAVIEWSLVTSGTHVAVATSPYISLSIGADSSTAIITRPDPTAGNVSIGLQAKITVGSLTNNRYFDLTILKDGAQ